MRYIHVYLDTYRNSKEMLLALRMWLFINR